MHGLSSQRCRARAKSRAEPRGGRRLYRQAGLGNPMRTGLWRVVRLTVGMHR